jgi:hypothetical protein
MFYFQIFDVTKVMIIHKPNSQIEVFVDFDKFSKWFCDKNIQFF